MLCEMNHDLARLAFIRSQMKAPEETRLKRVEDDPYAGTNPRRTLAFATLTRMGPPPRNPVAEANDCFMARVHERPSRIQGCGAEVSAR